jgi:putative phosphonate metabolism protein
MADEAPRYAVYFVPAAESGLYRFGSSVLQYDCYTGRPLPPPDECAADAGIWRKATEEPRRYGFHATLKAPFTPVEGLESAALLGDVESFAASRHPVRVRLEVGELEGFLALVPTGPVPALDRLAADCVREFDRHRAPSGKADLERRDLDRLSEAERQHLERWGYPYVLDRFRFHMTLTGPVEEPERGRIKAMLRGALAPHLAEPVAVDNLALFTQTHRVAPFRVVARFPLAAAR